MRSVPVTSDYKIEKKISWISEVNHSGIERCRLKVGYYKCRPCYWWKATFTLGYPVLLSLSFIFGSVVFLDTGEFVRSFRDCSWSHTTCPRWQTVWSISSAINLVSWPPRGETIPVPRFFCGLMFSRPAF